MPLFGHREPDKLDPGRGSRDAREAREASASSRDARGLAAALRDTSDPWAQREAAAALEQLGDASAVEALLEVLTDADPLARSCAAVALGRIGDRRAVGPLIQALADERWGVRRDAAEALGQLGDDRAADALGGLADDQPLVRLPAVEALRKIGGRRVATALAVFLHDREEDVRGEAIRAIAEIGGQRASTLLVEALADDSTYIREMTAEALGELGDPAAVEPLIAAANDATRPTDGALRALATLAARLTPEAAASSHRARLVAALAAALRSPSGDRRREAVECLESIAWSPATPADEAAYWAARRQWDLCVAVGPEAVDALIVAIEDWGGEEAVARGLAAMHPGPERFLAMLADASLPEASRLGAVGVLGSIGDSAHAAAIAPLLGDSSPAVRTAAIHVLGRSAGAGYVAEFGAALHDQDPDVRLAAAEALGQIGGPEAVELLEAAAGGEPLDWLRSCIATQLQNASLDRDDEAAGAEETDLAVLADLCAAYSAEDEVAVERLEPIAVEIGRQLKRRGGVAAMWAVCERLGDISGIESLERLWSHAGDEVHA